jgi:hypothetical protein
VAAPPVETSTKQKILSQINIRQIFEANKGTEPDIETAVNLNPAFNHNIFTKLCYYRWGWFFLVHFESII